VYRKELTEPPPRVRIVAVRYLTPGQHVRIDMHQVPGRGIEPGRGWVTVETVTRPVVESTVVAVHWRGTGTTTGVALYSGHATVLAEAATS